MLVVLPLFALCIKGENVRVFSVLESIFLSDHRWIFEIMLHISKSANPLHSEFSCVCVHETFIF